MAMYYMNISPVGSIKADRIGPIFFAAIIAGFLIIVSVGLEVFVAILFKFSGKQIAIIAGINTLTQVIMRLLYFILPLPHLISTVILETLVYISEFIVFRKMNIMKDEFTAKILCYVILANTLSLILGIKLLNWVD